MLLTILIISIIGSIVLTVFLDKKRLQYKSSYENLVLMISNHESTKVDHQERHLKFESKDYILYIDQDDYRSNTLIKKIRHNNYENFSKIWSSF